MRLVQSVKCTKMPTWEDLFLLASFLSLLLVISVARNKKLRLISQSELKRKRQSSCQARH